MPKNYYEFDLVELPYSYSDLEPIIDTETMRIHHSKHLKGYVDNLNRELSNYPKLQKLSLEQILTNPYILPANRKTQILNNGGGVYNHNFFFEMLMPPSSDNMPTENIYTKINAQFGSFDAFKSKFKEQALSVFGSGWLWLVTNQKGNLMLMPTANQQTPIQYGYCPILVIDLWEHAYYLKHQNRRNEYIDGWWDVINWQQVEKNYNKCMYYN